MGNGWTDTKRLAEVLGGAAVILSLVFVGFELRENVLATKAEAAHNVSMALQAWYLEMGANEQAGSVFRRGMVDPDSLDPDESFQFIMALHAVLLAYQDSYYLGEEGALDRDLQQVIASSLSNIRATPGFNWYWQQRRLFFNEDFRSYLDELAADDRNTAIIYQ